MANITAELNAIKTAITGEEVRTSIHDGIKKINDVVDAAQEAEDNRVIAEASRVTAETSRVEAETSRASVESQRVTDENSRRSQETARLSQEASRVSKETSRVTAETSRVTAETSRVQAENTRASAESNRTIAFNQAILNSEEATSRANAAAQACEDILEDIADGIDIHNLPVNFVDYTTAEQPPSLWESITSLLSGSPLQNLIKFIKGSLMRLSNKFNDVEYSYSGPALVYKGSNESKVLITKITGETKITIPDAQADVSPENPQTFITNDSLFITSDNSKNMLSLSTYTTNDTIKKYAGVNVIVLGGTEWQPGYSFDIHSQNNINLEANVEYVFKMIPIKGSVTGTINVRLSYLNNETLFVIAATISNTLNEVTFSIPMSANMIKCNVQSLAGTTPYGYYSFILSLSKKSDIHKASCVYVGNSLGSMGNYKETIEYLKDTNNYRLSRPFATGTLTSSSTVTFQSQNSTLAFFSYSTYSEVNENTVIECNRLPISISSVDDCAYPDTGKIIIGIKKSRLTGWNDGLTNVEKQNLMKTWLGNNNVIFRILMIEPFVYTLSDLLMLDTYEEQTNIKTSTINPILSFDADIKSRLWYMEYKKINKTMIAKNFLSNDWEQVAAAPLVKQLMGDMSDQYLELVGYIFGGNVELSTTAYVNQTLTNATTWYNLHTLTLEPGIYLLIGQVSLPQSASTGAVALRFTNGPYYTSAGLHPNMGNAIQRVAIINVTQTTSISLAAFSSLAGITVSNANVTWMRLLTSNE